MEEERKKTEEETKETLPSLDQPQLQTQYSLKIPKGTFEVLNPGNFADKYDLGEQIGEGHFGTVNKCILKSNREVIRAVKILKVSRINQDAFFHEMEMLKRASHPNVVQVFELFEVDHHYHIVTEYFQGPNLLERANQQLKTRSPFTEHKICHIMKGILEAINYCHSNSICHRDLKPENILINDKDDIKIIDFGLADIVKTNENSLSGVKGTQRYMAPEVMKGGSYNEKCDIWSIGHIFYLLMAFAHPFDNDEERKQGNYKRGKVEIRSENALDLLDKMLNPYPDERITAQQVLEHDWFKQNLCQEHQMIIDEPQKMMMLENLALMRDKHKLSRIVLSYMSSQQPILTSQEQQQVSIIFKQFDKDHDGRLGLDDVAQAFREIYPQQSNLINEEDMIEIIKRADTNGDGYIDIAEWHTIAISNRRILSDEYLKWAFKFFDMDGCGTITLDDFKHALKMTDDQFNQEYWKNLIKEVDQDQDGKINFEEFKAMMAQETKIASNCNVQ